MSFSTSSSGSLEPDNQNQVNMGAYGPNLGYIPRVPMPLGTLGTEAPIPFHPLPLPFPPSFHISSGQLQVDSSPGNYVISSHSLPITGREYFPQVENLSISSHNSWSSGFTAGLPDNSRMDRKTSNALQSSPEVSHVYAISEFQGIFIEAEVYVEYVHSLLKDFFDRSQIFALEECHRTLEDKIVRLVPLASQSTDSFNVHDIVKAIRAVQFKIEETLLSFFQNLSERDRMKVHFSLPQLRNSSYISVVNRSVHINQSVRDRSLSPNASLAKNASISYDHIKTSSPVKGESMAPLFNPPLEQNVKDNSILQGANHEVRIDARADSSISSPQIKQLEWQNDGVNSRHSSGIDSPRQNLSGQVNSPNMGESGNHYAPNMGDKGNFQAPKMGDKKGISARYLANFNIFLKRKNDVQVEVEKLLLSSKNKQIQPSTLKLMATDLKAKLTSLKIDKWVEDDKLGHFDPIDLCNWEDRMVKDINSVLYQTEDLINVRKGLAQSGIKKRDPPKFSGSVLDYPLFKKNWSIEVSPGGLPELIELNLLKDAVPLTAKDRLYEVTSMVEAWDILNKIYGKHFDLRNRLKQEFLAIKISQKFSPLVELEIFQKVQKLASRIKAAKAQSLLENDFEYISLVYQLLPEIQREKWVNHASSNPTWDSFYKFLEDMYEKALLKRQINEACEHNSVDNCCNGTVLAATVAVNACPVCEDSLHSVNTKEGIAYNSKRLISCPKFNIADDDTKKQLFASAQGKFSKICRKCTAWNHNTSVCKYEDVTCSNCGGNHFNDACSLNQI